MTAGNGRMSEVSTRVAADEVSSPPVARRLQHSRWRDPKLWVGIVVVLLSVVIGSRLLSSSDDSVAVWQLARDVPAGSLVARTDLQVTRVHFDQPSARAAYVLAADASWRGGHALRDLHAGELLARHALGGSAADGLRELPLAVSSVHQPADLRPGDHVEVWAVPRPVGGRPAAAPVRVLPDVTVLAVPGDGLTGAGARPVLVGVHAGVDVATILQRTRAADVVLVRLAR